MTFQESLNALLDSGAPPAEFGTASERRADKVAVVGSTELIRLLSEQTRPLCLGTQDIRIALEQIKPNALICEPVSRTAHPGWTGKLINPASLSGYFEELHSVATGLSIPLICLWTGACGGRSRVEQVLMASDLIFVSRAEDDLSSLRSDPRVVFLGPSYVNGEAVAAASRRDIEAICTHLKSRPMRSETPGVPTERKGP
ncbi:hypothetical protein [Zhihengliuella sp.]|uniref:hypothetical protein n=1 Tax=Zhihengliuella sp. TaxID=1954483 RepID=UPI002810AC67|nr:hypothetical protein [Zhihengliuella sp.]